MAVSRRATATALGCGMGFSAGQTAGSVVGCRRRVAGLFAGPRLCTNRRMIGPGLGAFPHADLRRDAVRRRRCEIGDEARQPADGRYEIVARAPDHRVDFGEARRVEATARDAKNRPCGDGRRARGCRAGRNGHRCGRQEEVFAGHMVVIPQVRCVNSVVGTPPLRDARSRLGLRRDDRAASCPAQDASRTAIFEILTSLCWYPSDGYQETGPQPAGRVRDADGRAQRHPRGGPARPEPAGAVGAARAPARSARRPAPSARTARHVAHTARPRPRGAAARSGRARRSRPRVEDPGDGTAVAAHAQAVRRALSGGREEEPPARQAQARSRHLLARWSTCSCRRAVVGSPGRRTRRSPRTDGSVASGCRSPASWSCRRSLHDRTGLRSCRNAWCAIAPTGCSRSRRRSRSQASRSLRCGTTVRRHIRAIAGSGTGLPQI